MIQKVLQLTTDFDYNSYTAVDVRNALSKDRLSFYDFGAILSPIAEGLIEEIAFRSKKETRKYYGNSVSLYTPLYISNFCDNKCLYCAFNSDNDIVRGKLTLEEIENELKAIAKTGLKEILLLTGESRSKSDVKYIGEAVILAKKYFSTIGIEIYPLSVEEYAYLNKCGVDFVSLYQETYDQEMYKRYHLEGPKQDFEYRFNSQERAVLGGMRGVSFGTLMGLADFRKDAFATGIHAYFIQQKYPHAEISFSAPRIRIQKNTNIDLINVTEKQLLQVMTAYRLFVPFVSINISTREKASFRDNVIGLAANKISAGVKVSVGGHDFEQKGDEQFEISDDRSVSMIHDAIVAKGLQPVYTDYISML